GTRKSTNDISRKPKKSFRKRLKNWEDSFPSKGVGQLESDRIVHVPVMLQEVLSLLNPGDESELLIDCTLGEGGHSERFLSLFPQLRVCGLDRDAAIQAKARKRLEVFGDRMEFFLGWYNEFFAEYPLKERPDRVLFDLGISVF